MKSGMEKAERKTASVLGFHGFQLNFITSPNLHSGHLGNGQQWSIQEAKEG